MKSLVFIFSAMFLFAIATAQKQLPVIPEKVLQKDSKTNLSFPDSFRDTFTLRSNHYVQATAYAPYDTIGHTRYDLQSNSGAPEGRLTLFPDGTMASVWTRGNSPTGYADRGTGYNYFDGTSWGDIDQPRLESVRTGWPSHAQLGAYGEIVVSHRSGNTGLRMLKRANKGTGNWDESDIAPPEGAAGLLWPRMVTGGANKGTVHIIVLTSPTANGGNLYHGQDGALIYMRSQDGGLTWDKNGVLPGIDSAYYSGWDGDRYSLAEPRGNLLAFVLNNALDDLVLMKSTDNGDTWQKTVVWHYPGQVTGPFYKPDGALHALIDVNGMVHLFFGVVRSNAENNLDLYSGGVAYWNENLPVWEGSDEYLSNCLNPDTLLVHNQLPGHIVDVNGNGYWDVNTECGNYQLGCASMPSAVINDDGSGLLVYSAITEGYSLWNVDYRHIWGCEIYNFGNGFGLNIDYTDTSYTHNFIAECIYPSVCQQTGELTGQNTCIYQFDRFPGLSATSLDPSENYVVLVRTDLIDPPGTGEPDEAGLLVSQNHPNPFSGITHVDISLKIPASLSISVSDITGRKLQQCEMGVKPAGQHTLDIDASELSSGVYFFTVKAGSVSMTKKMVVR